MPNIADLLKQGWTIHQTGETEEAYRIYQSVVEQVPQNAEAHVYLGIALFDLRRYDESIQAYRTALSLKDPFPIAWNNLGNSLRMVGDVSQSDACFEKALSQDPNYLSVFKNRGTLWVWAGEIERGLEWYERGLQIAPDEPEFHRNLGVIYLLLGEYEKGWPEYRWRWKMGGLRRPHSHAPLWTGQPLNGRTILLYPEQGRGDEMHFIRMATLLADQGAHVAVITDADMFPLFRSVRGISQLLATGSIPPITDYQASFIDAVDAWYQSHRELPVDQKIFVPQGNVQQANHLGYLNVSDAIVEYWRNWLQKNGLPVGGKKRIGITWQGNPNHHADLYRSVPLEVFRPIAEDTRLDLVSLQFGFGCEQLDEVDFGERIQTLPADTDATGGAFTDTAAVLKNLDYVVTTDTSLAHLAGALGIPTTVLIGRVPDWRWLCEGDSTSWYPSVRLARQTRIGDWSGAVSIAHQHIFSD